MKFLFTILLSLNSYFLIAQNILPTPAYDRIAGIEKRKSLEENSLVKNIEFTNIGPSIMSGRCVDLDVNPDDPTEFYVAYASGGLWHTTNNGLSFTPIFDNENVLSIGDIAVDWKHDKQIWVGTGEANSSRSSYSGIGIYKSGDGGKHWQYKGLSESHHIGKIFISADDSNTVLAGAMGHLYSSNKERGIYKTTDGGNSWKQVLFVNDVTGCADIFPDPANDKVLYADMWQRERRAWNFSESGEGSGIYKSTDGGDTWKLISTGTNGMPHDAGVGRIGLAISYQNSNVIYAMVDNQNHRAKNENKDTTSYIVDDLKNISKENFLKLNDAHLENFLRNNDFPEKYDAAKVKELVKKDKIKPTALVDYLNDANNSLFNTPIIGAELYQSDDAGNSWKKIDTAKLKGLVYTYGYYFGKIFVSPFDDKRIVICGVPLIMSTDGGTTFKTIDGDNTHGDHHAVWFDPKKEGHMIIGNDGGVNISYDYGANWFKCNTPAVGQFYSVTVDNDNPYNVYGGLQDNGVWTGTSDYVASTNWMQDGQYPYKFIYGGDGMQVQVDTRDNNTVYAGSQFGYYGKINKTTGETDDARPSIDLGEMPLRYNWQSPILLSKFNQDILYFGTNKLYRSMNQGKSFDAISPDLTNHDKTGDVPYNTITTICESPFRFGEIYIGTDDGNVQLTKDGGSSWTKISVTLPQNLYVSRVTASAFSESRIYVSLNGYRFDNFSPYLFVSDDFGKTWITIGTDLPMEPINVVKEDPKNENIIYVGTDNGLYVSLNRGKNFMAMNGGLPRVAIHDIAIQTTANEIVLGTHGRSLYKANLDLVQQLTDSLVDENVHAFSVTDIQYNKYLGKKSSSFDEPISRNISIPFYVKKKSITTVTVKSDSNIVVATLKDTSEAGINIAKYNLVLNENAVNDFKKSLSDKNKPLLEKSDDGKYYLTPGTYIIEIKTEQGASSKISFSIKKKEKKEQGNEGREREGV